MRSSFRSTVLMLFLGFAMTAVADAPREVQAEPPTIVELKAPPKSPPTSVIVALEVFNAKALALDSLAALEVATSTSRAPATGAHVVMHFEATVSIRDLTRSQISRSSARARTRHLN